MRRWVILVIAALSLTCVSRAQNPTIQGWCETGAQPVVTSGLTSSTQVQQSFPTCTVTVFVHGGGLATLFADASNTPLSNPFTATSIGRWLFYVAPGRYDVQLGGAGFPSPVTYSDIVTSSGGSGGTSPGGTPIQTQVNNNGAFGGTPCENFNSLSTGPENVDCDWHAKGPNPFSDVTRFNVRAVNPNTAPALPGITASINSGSKTATISLSSSFQNGDGVVVYGAGAPHSLVTPSAPTVVPSLAQAGTGTGFTVPSPSGSTTYQYQVVARDKAGGLTASSTATSTATGQASLGSQSVLISSLTRSNNTVTVTTASSTDLAVGAQIMIGIVSPSNDVADGSWTGTYQVASVTDGTHFTFTSGQDTRNGAPSATTASFSGTLYWMNCNHITWPAVTGAWQYYVYGRTAGSMVLLGVTHPSASNVTDTTFDDFGSTMMSNSTSGIPPYVPSAPPGAASSDNLVTTITAGAGTTTLTLNTAAGTTVSGQTIRFDNCPNILTAATTFRNLYWPLPTDQFNNAYVVNSLCDVAASVAQNQSWMYAGGLSLNETMILEGSLAGSQPNVVPGHFNQTFTLAPSVTITTNSNPGIYFPTGTVSFVNRIEFSGGQNPVFIDSNNETPAQPQFGDHVGFYDGSVNPDYMGIALYWRDGNGIRMGRINAIVGPGAQGAGFTGTSFTPSIYFRGMGHVTIDMLFSSTRGVVFQPSLVQSSLDVRWGYTQGGSTPFITIIGPTTAGAGNASVKFEHLTDDTTFQPFLSYLPTAGTENVSVTVGYNDQIPGGSAPIITGPTQGWAVAGVANVTGLTPSFTRARAGQNVNSIFVPPANALALDSVFVPTLNTGPGPYVTQLADAAIAAGPSYPIFIDSTATAAPTCAVSAGGSWAVGSYTFFVTPIWQNGAAGNPTQASTPCVTTTGNQTITLTAPTFIGSPLGVDFYNSFNGSAYSLVARNGSNDCSTKPQVTVSGGSLVLSAPGSCSNVPPPSISAGGPTMFMPGVQGIATPAIVLSGSQAVTGVQGTDTSFLSSGTVSASTGIILCTDANHGATTSGCPSTGTFYQTVDANGTAQTQRPTLNLISGTNATVSCVDNGGATRTDCTFAANATTAWSSITAATNSNAGTFAASGNTWDFSAATSFKIPVAGGAAPTADGAIADNSTTHGFNFGSNGSTLNVAVASTGAGGTGTTCAANSAVTAVSNTAAPTCTQLTGGGLPYTNWGVNSSCTQTGSGAGATQTCTISFNNTEANTAYKIVCGGTGTITGYPFMQGVITKNTTNAVVQYTNGTSNEAVASGWANIECILTR